MSVLNNAMVIPASAEAYTIDYGCVFESGSELSLTYTLNAPWTFSGWVKKTALSSLLNLLGTNAEIHFNTNDTLEAEGTSSTALFRDVAQFYHVHVSNNGLFVNNVSHGSVTTTNLSNAKLFDDFEGVVAEIHLKSGTDAVTNFGETDSTTGQWVPKQATSGEHYLDFSNSSNLGENSGTGSDWTATGLAASDQVTDTPTSNHCTWNALDSVGGSNTLADGALKVTTSNSVISAAVGTFCMSSGKWYWEFTPSSVTGVAQIGIVGFNPGAISTNGLGQSPVGYSYVSSSGNKGNNNSFSAYGATYTNSDVIGIALDLDAGTLTFYKNNVSQGVAFTGLTGTFMPAVSDSGGATTIIGLADFGQRGFAYTPPSGYVALSVSNLSDPGISDPSQGLQIVLDTEADIASSLATARSGWTDYVDLLKNLDSSETWAWQFSHDSSNEYAVSTTATRQAKRTLSGTDNWVGFSLRIGSTYGTAAGSQAHTTGSGTTVTHNLGEADGFILLFPRSNGAVYAYHPDLTSGDLLVLTSTAAETASTIITNVGANSFDIGSAAGTDTYDYLVITNQYGFTDLGLHEGNGSANGRFSYGSVRSALAIIKRMDGVGDWVLVDDEREGYNVDNNPLYLNLANAEATTDLLDIVSNGLKMRSTDTDINASGGDYISVKIARAAFKDARAR